MNRSRVRSLTLASLGIMLGAGIVSGQSPGTKLWQFKTDNEIRASAALSPDGSIYLTSGKKTYALDSRGQFQWQIDGDSIPPVLGPNGTLYLITDRRFHAIDPNGKLLWRFTVDDPLEFECCAAVAQDGTIYLASEGQRKKTSSDPDDNRTIVTERFSRLYSISATGQGIWRLNFNTLIASGPVINADGSPMLGLGTEKIAAYTSRAVHRWNVELSDDAVVAPAIGPDGTIYVSDNRKILYAISPEGRIRWIFRPGDWLLSSPAVGLDGTIYFGCDNRRLYAFNPDGTKKWEFVAEGGIRSSPAIAADNTVYFGGIDRKVYALDSRGNLLWTFATSGPIFSSPTIDANGTVLIGSDDRNLYALKGTSPLAQSSWPKYRGGARQSGRPFEMGRPGPTLPRIAQPIRQPGGVVELSISSSPGVLYSIESSSDLKDWIRFSTGLGTGEPLQISDHTAPNDSARFYRVRVLP